MKNFYKQTGLNAVNKNILSVIGFILLTLPGFTQLGWVQVPSPNPSASRNMVRGISGTSSSDVWAVGSYEEIFSFNPYYVERDLLLHWNGNSWQQFPALNLSTTLDDLWDVEAISTNNVWAVGNYNDFANTRAELLHYNGSSWTNQPLPFIIGGSYLYSLHALNANDIWAAGGKAGSPTRPAYVMHYNGSSWSEVNVPIVGTYRNAFNEIDGISSNDIWAVGHLGNSYGDFHALAMHWDGSSWTNINLPGSVVNPLSEILNITMIASNDVWAVGYYLTGGGFTIHWDGNSWTEITPFIGGGAFAAVSTDNVFSLGAEILNWNGTSWTMVDPLTQLSSPSLGSTVVFSNGEIWAGGRTVDASNKFFSLIYRSVNNVPLFTGGTTQTWNVAVNSNNNLPGNLLLTLDADVSQILNYSIVIPPAHGTLSGLPATAITNNGSASPAGIGYSPMAGYTGPDQFTVRVAAGPVHAETTINLNVLISLPVTLTDFRVSKQGKHSLLEWSTASEFNAQKFEIEQSVDGIRFITAGNIAAIGNSSITNSYSFIHNSPSPGQNYYRLKLYDRDGRTSFSSIKSIWFDSGLFQPVVLLANPVQNNEIRLQVNEKAVIQLSIYDMQGKKLLTKAINNSTAGNLYTLTMPGTMKGIYILEVKGSQHEYAIKFLLQ